MNKYQLSLTNLRDTLHDNKRAAKVDSLDTQCDKLVTKLSWQRLWR